MFWATFGKEDRAQGAEQAAKAAGTCADQHQSIDADSDRLLGLFDCRCIVNDDAPPIMHLFDELGRVPGIAGYDW